MFGSLWRRGKKTSVLLSTPWPRSHPGEKRQRAIAGEITSAGFSLRSGEAPTMPLVSTEHTSIGHAATEFVASMQSRFLPALGVVVVALRAKANIHNPHIVSLPAITNKQRAPAPTPAEAQKRPQPAQPGKRTYLSLQVQQRSDESQRLTVRKRKFSTFLLPSRQPEPLNDAVTGGWNYSRCSLVGNVVGRQQAAVVCRVCDTSFCCCEAVRC